MNWDKFEEKIIINLRNINASIDYFVSIEDYEEAYSMTSQRDNIYFNIISKIDNFNAYNATINNAYEVLGYNPIQGFLE